MPTGLVPVRNDHITTAFSWRSKCDRGVGCSWSDETDISLAFNLTVQSHPYNCIPLSLQWWTKNWRIWRTSVQLVCMYQKINLNVGAKQKDFFDLIYVTIVLDLVIQTWSYSPRAEFIMCVERTRHIHITLLIGAFAEDQVRPQSPTQLRKAKKSKSASSCRAYVTRPPIRVWSCPKKYCPSGARLCQEK